MATGYRILSAVSIPHLTKIVNEEMRRGMKPCGGVSYASDAKLFIQAVAADESVRHESTLFNGKLEMEDLDVVMRDIDECRKDGW